MGPKMSRPSLSLNLFIRLLYCSAWGSLVNVKDPGHCKYPLVLKKRWVAMLLEILQFFYKIIFYVPMPTSVVTWLVFLWLHLKYFQHSSIFMALYKFWLNFKCDSLGQRNIVNVAVLTKIKTYTFMF